MRDTLLSSVDYGDADPTLRPSRPFQVAAWLQGSTPLQQTIQNLEYSCQGLFPPCFPSAHRSFPGMNLEKHGVPFAGIAGWSKVEMDPVFSTRQELKGPLERMFDKLTWRSGWRRDAAYLALEGVGNETISHAHNEANGILRFNCGGRIWLTSNGYGKKSGSLDASRAFSTRERGPSDHNMLVVRESETGKAVIPPANALLLGEPLSAPLPVMVSELRNYGGVCWRRHCLLLKDFGLAVVDRISAECSEGGALPEFHLEWNLLGDFSPQQDGLRLTQNGMELNVWHCGTAQADEPAIHPSEGWRRVGAR